jgi:hypothetical protein
LRTILTFLTVLLLSTFTGCESKLGTIKSASSNEGKEFLTVDFKDGQTLRYKFASGRDIIIDWEPSKTELGQQQTTLSKSSESMEMVVAYTPVEINPYGLTTIKATCESVNVRRSDGTPQDAVKHFADKTYTFKVGPTGKIEDNSQLDELIKEIGEIAFQPDTGRGRIKEPDMIGDFVASQWFLWDSVSSIKNASEGVSPGQSWQSKLSLPTPMVTREARDVTYKLEEIRESEKGRLAVISSSYSKADSVPQSWPVPYKGRFQMRGRFGFLGNYKLMDLQGSGEEIFNITLGRTEKYNQQYQAKMQASIPLGIGESPEITIKQNLTMDILED